MLRFISACPWEGRDTPLYMLYYRYVPPQGFKSHFSLKKGMDFNHFDYGFTRLSVKMGMVFRGEVWKWVLENDF